MDGMVSVTIVREERYPTLFVDPYSLAYASQLRQLPQELIDRYKAAHDELDAVESAIKAHLRDTGQRPI